ncbi:CDGSH iron-sulfur domain-containing protein [Kangiella sp. TOML190]|uniref:CDGSH iron-sulfur domain-containing protein n=1 Tax=Kangiella sp. TOML190 TaxID=2931351 RepID=UPI00204174DB|nr:CDGSH iron-sulfur domain-containing protein [Kangiella sp. TOML190]
MATIKATDHGPLLLTGECAIEDADGQAVATKKVTALCRCGASNNKPFCDGSHKSINWQESKS